MNKNTQYIFFYLKKEEDNISRKTPLYRCSIYIANRVT